MIVKHNGRTFFVTVLEGKAVHVKERVIWAPGKPWEAFTDYTRWSVKYARPRPRRGYIFEVIKKAEAS